MTMTNTTKRMLPALVVIAGIACAGDAEPAQAQAAAGRLAQTLGDLADVGDSVRHLRFHRLDPVRPDKPEPPPRVGQRLPVGNGDVDVVGHHLSVAHDPDVIPDLLRSSGFEVLQQPEHEVYWCRRAEVDQRVKQELAEVRGEGLD